MSLNAAMIQAMVDKGLSAQDIADIAKAGEAKVDRTAAERQARHRAKRNAVTSRRDPPIDRTHTPSDISPDGENQNSRGKPNPFPKPDWAEQQVWDDWLEIRKQKKARNTATAYACFLADITKLTNDEWPPGRLLEYAVAHSWAGIYEPKEGYPTNVRQLRPADDFASLRGNRPNGALDMVLESERELQAEAERENPGADWSPRAALPPGQFG